MSWGFTNGIAAGGALVGTERFPADDVAGGSESFTAGQILFYVQSKLQAVGKYSADAHTVGFTAAAGQLAPAELVVLNLTGALAAGAALTLPTAASVVALLPDAKIGQTWLIRFINNSSAAFTWTITSSASMVVTGTAIVAQNTWREFLVTLTSLTAATLQNVGSGGN